MRSHCVRLATVVALLAVALTSGTARATTPGPPVSNIVRTVLGAQKTAVIFVKWDNVADTFSPQSASDRLYDVQMGADTWLREASAGQAWLTGKSGTGRADMYYDASSADGNQWYTIPVTWPACNSGSSSRPLGIISSAESRAASDGFNAADYQLVIVVAQRGADCQVLGQGFPAPYTNPGSVLYTDNLDYGTLNHEMGHAFGLEHAGRIDCLNASGSTRLPLSDNCTTFGYGDPYDVMGASGTPYDNWRKFELGWLPAANAVVADTTGTYTLAQSEYPVADATQLISIPRRDASGNTFGWIQLEVRMSYGQFDQLASNDPARTGVIVRLSPFKMHTDTGGDTAIITTDTVHNIMPLQVGKTFTDVDGHIVVTTKAMANGVAQVFIATADPSSTILTTPKKGQLEVDGAAVGNDITVTKVKSTVTVHDNAAPLWALNGCVLVDANTATCTKVNTVIVNGGDGDDHLHVVGNLKSTLNGGNGNDTLIGGTAADVFIGGDGFDTVDYSAKTKPVVAKIAGGRVSGVKGEHDDIRSDIENVILPTL
jgi:hypothetical protein